MKTIRIRNLCPMLLLALLLPSLSQVAHSATIVWTNTLGGNWSTAANWNPNQVPGSGDTANITNAGTYDVILNVNASVFSLAIGGASSGVQTLEGTSFTLAVTNATVNGGGVLGLSNSTFSGPLTIASGGVFNDSSETIDGQMTVQSGAKFLANGYTTMGGNVGSSNEWLWVRSGGLLNVSSGGPIFLYIQMTNAGTLNFSNSGSIYNPGNSVNYDGGLVNAAGGIVNLIGGANISGSGGFDSLLNQGSINVSNGTSSISMDNMINQATVATLSGTATLTIGNFNGLGTLTGTYNAAAGTIIKFVSNNNPGASAGAPLTLGGSGQYQFTAGLLTLPTNVIPGLALDGGILSLGAGFQGGAITNLVLNGMILTNSLPISGTLAMTNGTLTATNTLTNGVLLSLYGTTLDGAIIVTNNGVLLTSGGATLDAQVTVENGGEFLANGTTTLGGNTGSSNEWLWVQSGGLFNAGSVAPIYLYVQLTNAGTLNSTNYGISMYNPGGSPNYDGGLVNQAGGIITLIGGANISGSGGFDFVLNQGTINAAGSSTIGVDNMINQAIVATLPGAGTLTIGNFNGLDTLVGTYNAAAGTIIKFVSNNNPGASVGAGLTLGGSGQYQFTGGLLTLPTNVIPDLALDGGTLSLGAGFQGGAITNLVLNNMNLTNTLPITGTLAMTNGTLFTTNTLSNGALLSLNGATLYGSIIVPNNGVLLLTSSATLDAQVTVENGGEILASGSATLGGNVGSSNEWLWVQSGGLFNAASSAPIYSYVQVTNAGTLNFTNSGISTYNPGNSPNYDGGLINTAGGIINLVGTAGISASGGFDVLLNQGAINITNGNSSINVDNLTNFATLNAGLWTLQLQSTNLSLQPSGSLDVALAGPTTFGKFNITGKAALTGALVVTLSNSYLPAVGSAFVPLSYNSFSGGFTSFNLARLPAAAWQPVYSTNELTLVIQPLIAFLPSGTNLVVSVNAAAGHQAVELTDTNLTAPLANWTPLNTNTIDVTTYLSVTNNFDPTEPRRFFTFQLK